MLLITGPCGAGKTKKALQIAMDVVASGGHVLYISPTRALSEQFAQDLEQKRIKVARAFGRRLGENCENPNLDIAVALGEGFGPICAACSFRYRCKYLAGIAEFSNPVSPVIVTTYHMIAWSFPSTYPVPDLTIVDDINDPILSSPANMPPRSTALVSILAGPKKNKQYHFLPPLPAGKETIVISATPVPSFLRYQIEQQFETEVVGNDPTPLDQVVVVHLAHHTHTSPWFPPPGTCGFKKNTMQGYPYFRASIGLNDWRGIGLKVAGSFSPPIQVYSVLAAIMSRLTGEKHSVCFLPIVMKFDRQEINSGIFCVRNHKVIADVSAMLSVHPLVQLLGRSGRGVQTEYYGDIPLNFLCEGEETVSAKRVVLASIPPSVQEFHSMRFRVAQYLLGNLPLRQMNSQEKRYLGFVQSVLSQANNDVKRWVAQGTPEAE